MAKTQDMEADKSSSNNKFDPVVLMAVTAILWPYIEKSFFNVVFQGYSLAGWTEASLLLMLSAFASSTAVAIACGKSARFSTWSGSSTATLAAGCIASAGSLAAIALCQIADAAGWAFVLFALCLLIQPFCFCLVFLSLARRLVSRAGRVGVVPTVVEILFSVVIGHLMCHNGLNDTPFTVIFDVAGTVLAGLLLFVYPQKEPVGPELASSPVSAGLSNRVLTGRTAKPFEVLVFLFFLLSGLIVHAARLGSGFSTGEEDSLSYLLTATVLFAVAAVVQYLDRREGERENSALVLPMCLAMLVFLAIFATVFVFSTQGDYSYSLIRFVRRTVLPLAFVTVILIACRLEGSVARTVGLLFLSPFFLAKLLQLTALSVLPRMVPQFSGNQYLLLVYLVVGFCLVVAFGAFCVVMFGPSTREGAQHAVEMASSKGKAEDEVRVWACEDIARQYFLTPRELDTLKLLSRRLSAKEIAGELCVSEGTVNTHSASLYRKLGVHTRAEVESLVADTIGRSSHEAHKNTSSEPHKPIS